MVDEYARLALEILSRARLDLQGRGRLRDDAYEFFFLPSGYDDLHFWCAVAGLSVDEVRRSLPAVCPVWQRQDRKAA